MSHRPLLRLAAIGLLFASTASSLACATSQGSAARPPGLPENINETFLSEELDVDAYVERFEGESRAVFAERGAIVEALELSPGDSIADIGAGTGFFTALFDEAVGEAGTVYAVEISPRFLDHLRQRALDEGLGSVRVIEGKADSVELPPASIDIAFICDVYHHFENPEASLASLHAALRPGGALVLIDFERIPGVSPAWLLEHVRAGREVFTSEIMRAGFAAPDEVVLEGLEDNYFLRFQRLERPPANGATDAAGQP